MNKKVILVDQLGKKDFEYDYSAIKHYSNDYTVTCYMADDTPRNVQPPNTNVEYGFKNVYSGGKIHNGIMYLKALCELFLHINRNKYDIVHFQWYEIPIVDKLFVKAIKAFCKPTPKIVMTVHGVATKADYKYLSQGLQKLYQEADAILIHTKASLELFEENYDVKCPKYIITSAFRDAEDYKPIDKTEARRILGLPENKTIILSFGTVRDDKSIDLLLSIYPKIKKKNKNLYLIVAGTLNVSDKERYLELSQKCIDVGDARIKYEYIDKDLEGVYYSAADILVLPYSFISQSGVAYCGLLYHLPMIASDIPRLEDMAQKDVNADLFKKGDEEDLGKAILMLASDREKLNRYALGSQEVLEHDFSIQRRVDLTEQAYRELFL